MRATKAKRIRRLEARLRALREADGPVTERRALAREIERVKRKGEPLHA